MDLGRENDVDFCAVFQPIHSLASRGGSIFGWEALLRGPQGTPFQSPQALFEEGRARGRLSEFDRLAFELACRTFAANDPGGLLFVNLFPETLLTDEFAAVRLYRFLTGIGLAPERVVIEIVERHADLASLKVRVEALTTVGIRFALDDFGVGDGDLLKWIELEPHFLKLDRILTQGVAGDPRRQRAIGSLEALCRQTSTTLLAEGIETAEDAGYLRERTTIHLMQGYFFGRPEPLLSAPREAAGSFGGEALLREVACWR